MELEECIKDAVDTAMQDYIKSDSYQSEHARIDGMMHSFEGEITESQRRRFRAIVNALSTEHGLFSAEAYKNGVLDGILLLKKNESSVEAARQ